MVWKIFERFNHDAKCLPKRIPNYWEMIKPIFGPCRGICKPFVQIREEKKETKTCKNCCAYCIKINSVTKMERAFLKHKTFDSANYLKPGAACVVNMEKKYLKGLKDKKKMEKVKKKQKKNLVTRTRK